ncbi:RHS repeat-associated core domain-containing protein [Pseudomonas sp. G166]|uniref:RHS repeat-associated core domain-containing protein n=1 Tax=Pseudomonas sp. G166 TaxID=3094846 RepID=UPI00300A129E
MTRSRSDDDEHSRQSQTILLAADDKHSILAEVSESQTCSIAYSAYGHQSTQQVIATRLGFNGELQEARLGWYFLGKGYRVYNPVLMRFHSPDSWSPFGKGGLNAYMYCMGDPVNSSDPTGHIGFLKKLLTPFRPLTNASSTSSLAPLVPEVDRQGVINPHFIDTAPIPRYENIPTITGQTRTTVTIKKTNVPRLHSEVPPPIPPKQKLLPRFNDSGGQAGIISPNWKPGEPPRYRIILKRRPFQSTPAPLPPTRVIGKNSIRQYSVSYDKLGNPKQSSLDLTLLPLANETIRNTN